ncbi:MAG: tetratricopeptide repeat protein, partial [Saprospiraceae bacterium]|nr:tetratricopeptide repeat protein [Saprospiraceae bacterium]
PEPTQPPAPEIENETAPTTKPPTIKPTTVITQKVEEVEDDDVAVDDDENIATLNDSDSTNVNLKKKNKPDRYFLKRPPAYYEGMLWLARTFIERQKFEEAQITLNTLSEDRKTRKSVRRQIPTVQAYYYLKQKRYEDAVKPLESAIKTARSKKDKARYHYILAQLHSLAGRQEAAYASFDKAQRMTNNYEMGFSAKLNKVLSAYHAGKQSSDDAISTLTKMTKDSKNKENKDQIYFALANIALKENNNTLAIENLKNSLLYNTANKSQKGESYLKLANLYYEQEDYINAKNYFDSTLLILSPADERYAEAGRNALNLKEIAENLSEIKLQDSLLAINKLSDKEKFALAQKMKDEQQKAEAATSKPADVSSFQPNDPISANIKPSQFFAYSDKALRKGRTEFTSIWGSRTLEDNWRRSNKRGGQEIAIANNVEEQETKSSLTKEEVDLILKDVPNTDAEIKTANDNIMTAMFNLGKLYRDKLQSNKKSIDILEKLIERYPGTTNELDAFYYLYLANTELPNAVRAEYYKNQIILRYPSTTYAKILLDPNFLAAARTKEQELNKYYNETYQIFNKGEYQNAFERIAAANERYGTQHTLQPKFLLLNAMCIGNLKGKDAYIKGLKDVITRYPETEEQRRAKEILRLLEGDKPDTLAEKSGNITEITKFKREDDKLHYIIIVMQNDDNIDKVKSAIADYNRRFYESEQLKMSNIYLNFEAKVKQPIIILRKFDNKEKGMKYYNGVKSNPTAFLQGYTYEIFTVTQENYRVLLQDKSVEEYRNYFSENYLK